MQQHCRPALQPFLAWVKCVFNSHGKLVWAVSIQTGTYNYYAVHANMYDIIYELCIHTCAVSSGANSVCLLCVRSWGGLLTRQREARSGRWGLWLSLATKMELQVHMYEMGIYRLCELVVLFPLPLPMCLLMEGWGVDMDKKFVHTLYIFTYVRTYMCMSYHVHKYVCMYVPHSLSTVLPQHTYIHYSVHTYVVHTYIQF